MFACPSDRAFSVSTYLRRAGIVSSLLPKTRKLGTGLPAARAAVQEAHAFALENGVTAEMHEAQAAMKKARKLLVKYNLEQGDLEAMDSGIEVLGVTEGLLGAVGQALLIGGAGLKPDQMAGIAATAAEAAAARAK